MKKLFVITLFAILFAVSAQAQTEASKMPAEVQTALHKAIKAEQADPPIDVFFLIEVSFDNSVKEYIEIVKLPIDIPLGKGHIVIGTGEHGRVLVTVTNGGCSDYLECHNDGPYFSGIVQKDENSTNYNCAVELTKYLRSHRQSEFWTALKAAIQIEKKKVVIKIEKKK